ncbi:MAG: exonuclease domain-containing protein [Pseudoruegeria sp.]
MLEKLPLRIRIFLFFALLGLGGCVAVLGASWFGYNRLGDPAAASAFITSSLLACFILLVMSAGIWLLFDEHVAKAVERLAGDMRSRAHAGVDHALDQEQARHLGDLAPAATAVTQVLAQSISAQQEQIKRETDDLHANRQRLEAILSTIETPVLLCNHDHRVAFYNAAATSLLGAEHLGLNRPVQDALDWPDLQRTHTQMAKTSGCKTANGCQTFGGTPVFANMRPYQADIASGYLLTLDPNVADPAADTLPRHTTYDFSVLDAPPAPDVAQSPLVELPYVVFDTETTGLSVLNGDRIVQIAAVRVLNGRILETETFNSLVNPDRPIPATATRIHHITDADVKNAPPLSDAGKCFYNFCKGAVLVAHNAPFDIGMLRRDRDEIGAYFDHPVLDTVLLSAVVFGQSAEHTLDAIADRLGVVIPIELRHTAHGDAIATAEVFLKLLSMMKAQGIHTFAQAKQKTSEHRRLLGEPGS